VIQQQGGHIEHLMQKLQDVSDVTITETINTLFPVVNFLKLVTEVFVSTFALRHWHFTM